MIALAEEHLSSTNSDLMQTPFLNRTPETFESITDNSHERFHSCEVGRRGVKRSLSESISRFQRTHAPSLGVWKSGLARRLQNPGLKENYHPASHGESQASSLFDELRIDFEHNHKAPDIHYVTDASAFSSQFPKGHQLDAGFVEAYQLQDELGSGGYGFVMTANDRIAGHEVAVKFIIKDKMPEHAWMEDKSFGRLPTEVVLLSCINHESIVKYLSLFEDELFFYMVQELHGSPWEENHTFNSLASHSSSSSSISLPPLSPSSSEASLPASEPATPPKMFASLKLRGTPVTDDDKLLDTHFGYNSARPEITRRPSHDLFECIEQSENKRLTDEQARYVFAQVVDAVEYLDSLGIAHRDIKDENVVIDKNLKVKLIDFGSAIGVDPSLPRPTYQIFYGTAAYASSEILLKQEYKAAPAEIWTLGVLLSYLLAGISPFPNIRDAVDGRISLPVNVVGEISYEAMDLMRRCLNPNPRKRATISQVKAHPWLRGKQ